MTDSKCPECKGTGRTTQQSRMFGEVVINCPEGCKPQSWTSPEFDTHPLIPDTIYACTMAVSEGGTSGVYHHEADEIAGCDIAYVRATHYEKLLAFAAALLMPGDMIWNHDGADIEAAGKKAGLVDVVPYDPEKHGEEIGEEWGLDPGDDINQVVPFVVEASES